MENNTFKSFFKKIDINSLQLICQLIIIYFASYKVSKIYEMYKESLSKDINTILKSPNNHLLFTEFKDNFQHLDIISTFIYTLFKHFNTEDLTIFWNNITTLSIEVKDSLSSSQGYYIYNNEGLNKIEIEKQILIPSIYHELFHVASTNRFTKGISFCGFSQGNNKQIIGKGLNEGYTELLTQRYFGLNEDISDAYIYLTIISSLLESIVDKDKMQSLYLKADLFNLINELAKYASENEIMKFIASTDFLLDYLDSKPQIIEKRIILNSLKFVNYFLIKCSVNKNLLEAKKGLISNNKAKSNINLFVSKLLNEIKTNGIKYKIMNDEFIERSIISSYNEFYTKYNKALEYQLKK